MRRSKIISFSGIDGAGKTTQIDLLCTHFKDVGVDFKLSRFWDDAVALASLRERASHKIFRGDRGVGSPANPIQRRDKNVTSWYATTIRFFLYALDAIKLCALVHRLQGKCKTLVFDRYLYDELANLPVQSRFAQVYFRILLRYIPVPDVAFLLDAEPESATARKPEYPMEFARRNRDAYLLLAEMAGMTILPPDAIEKTADSIRRSVYSVGLEPDSFLRRVQAQEACFQADTIVPDR